MNDILEKYTKRTKIIITIGPAFVPTELTLKNLDSQNYKNKVNEAVEKIKKAINLGVSCFRLNFSHGSYEEHEVKIRLIRKAASELKKNVAIMLDTKGPEIRCGKFVNGKCRFEMNHTVVIYTLKKIIGNSKEFSVVPTNEKYNMADDIKIGQSILVDDGKLELIVEWFSRKEGKIRCKIINTHTLFDNKRINLPGSKYSMDFLSNKDKNDIAFGCKNDVDYIAASFVASKDNIKSIRDILVSSGKRNIQIISKIENSEAIDNIDEIISASDGIMIARGDLALDINYYDVPYWEKQIIRKCRFSGKPCIVATQMLDSLERNVQPTRAEVTDVFFAVERGADATMLSGESAQGLFPIIAIETMATINVSSELLFDYNRAINYYFSKSIFKGDTYRQAKKIAKKVLPDYKKFQQLFKFDFVVLFSNDNLLIRALSAIRPAATIVVVTEKEDLLKKFAISYGVQTYFAQDLDKAKLNYKSISKSAIKLMNKNFNSAIAYFNKKFHYL